MDRHSFTHGFQPPIDSYSYPFDPFYIEGIIPNSLEHVTVVSRTTLLRRHAWYGPTPLGSTPIYSSHCPIEERGRVQWGIDIYCQGQRWVYETNEGTGG